MLIKPWKDEALKMFVWERCTENVCNDCIIMKKNDNNSLKNKAFFTNSQPVEQYNTKKYNSSGHTSHQSNNVYGLCI